MRTIVPAAEDSEIENASRLKAIRRAQKLAGNSTDGAGATTIPCVLLYESEEKLRQSEARYRALVDCSPEAIAVQRDGRIIYVNPAAVKMMGATSPSQLLGKPMIDLVHPDFRAMVLDRLRKAAELGEGLPMIEEKLVRMDGTTIDVEVQGTMITYDGEPAIYGSMRDVTERRMAEDRLRHNLTFLNMASRVGRLGAWMVELPSMKLTFSEEVRNIHEVPPDFMPSVETAIGFYLPEYRPAISKAVDDCVRDGTPFDLELQFGTAKGRRVWVRSIGEAERDAHGKIVRIHGAFQDISERKAAEIWTRDQAALIDKANDAFTVLDLENRVVFWSKGAERLYGWTSQEAVGRLVTELIRPDPATFEEALAAVLLRGDWSGEIHQADKDGANVTVGSRWTLLRDALNNPKSILAIATDITERKKIEAQFLRAQRMESIGTLAGGIAHDLNNLLSPIAMGVELLRQFDTNPKFTPIIDTIEQSATRGTALVRQVLSFARGIEGSRVLVQVRDIVREVRSITENTFPKNITINVSTGRDLWPVLADPTQLNQVLLNLTVNARDSMPDGGRLDLKIHNVEIDEQFAVMNRGASPGKYVAIQVTDSGFGIPKEIIDRIFEPFFTTKEMGKGTGLGLSTVIGIVRSHGGFVNVYSELGKGSDFKVYLPAQPDIVPDSTQPPSVEKLPRGNGELILVVDDEVSILDITKQTLQTFGYRVLTAEDGAHAIGVYATRRAEIAVVITDMMMPVMDGVVLIAALRRINPKVRVIAASGLNANINVTRVQGTGVRHFLAKPYSADTLLQTLKAALAEGIDPSRAETAPGGQEAKE